MNIALLAWNINIFNFVLIRLNFGILALLNLNRFDFNCSSWWRQHIVIVSLRLAYIIKIDTLYGWLRSDRSIQILVVISFSIIILWYRRFNIHSLVLYIFSTIFIFSALLILTVINICLNSTLVLFRKMIRTNLIINIFIYFTNIVQLLNVWVLIDLYVRPLLNILTLSLGFNSRSIFSSV